MAIPVTEDIKEMCISISFPLSVADQIAAELTEIEALSAPPTRKLSSAQVESLDSIQSALAACRRRFAVETDEPLHRVLSSAVATVYTSLYLDGFEARTPPVLLKAVRHHRPGSRIAIGRPDDEWPPNEAFAVGRLAYFFAVLEDHIGAAKDAAADRLQGGRPVSAKTRAIAHLITLYSDLTGRAARLTDSSVIAFVNFGLSALGYASREVADIPRRLPRGAPIDNRGLGALIRRNRRIEIGKKIKSKA